jgi:hypothetical protein
MLGVILAMITGFGVGMYPTARGSAASLFALVADALPDRVPTTRPQLALRDLQLLDGAFAQAARWAGVPVTDLDTTARS